MTLKSRIAKLDRDREARTPAYSRAHRVIGETEEEIDAQIAEAERSGFIDDDTLVIVRKLVTPPWQRGRKNHDPQNQNCETYTTSRSE